MLTAAAYGVCSCVRDKPASGGRTSELTVRTMIEEARSMELGRPFRLGVAAGRRPVPGLGVVGVRRGPLYRVIR
jgi:hypothetical protein